MLETYNFCKNCPENGVLDNFQEDAEYDSYYESIYMLTLIFIFFRLVLLAILIF